MSYGESDTIDWQVIVEVDKWLDDNVSQEYKDQPLAQDWARISKTAEEIGETVSAEIGATGQNPRKGMTSTKEDMLYELADTAMTAILAIQHFTKDNHETRDILRRKQEFIYRRLIDARSR